MNTDLQAIGWVAAALVTAMVVALITTPVVRALAFRVGAVDVPKDSRRMHDHPIPRMGGLAIFFGFILSAIIYVEITPQFQGMMLGAVIIVVLGIFDDIYALGAKFKLLVQIAAALVAVHFGNVIQIISNPNVLSPNPYWDLGWLAVPATVLWIVAITNAVNLIDGLDGLACGVSTISSMTMLVISLAVADGPVAVIMAALAGGCIGFLPYNLNPAKIFMGDTGSMFIGGATVGMAMVLRQPLMLLLIAFTMVGSSLSVMMQVTYFKLTHGKRIFKMSPIHHHFELCGYSETQIVSMYAVVTGILSFVAVLSLNGLKLY